MQLHTFTLPHLEAVIVVVLFTLQYIYFDVLVTLQIQIIKTKYNQQIHCDALLQIYTAQD